jgi:hypothetical protein
MDIVIGWCRERERAVKCGKSKAMSFVFFSPPGLRTGLVSCGWHTTACPLLSPRAAKGGKDIMAWGDSTEQEHKATAWNFENKGREQW